MTLSIPAASLPLQQDSSERSHTPNLSMWEKGKVMGRGTKAKQLGAVTVLWGGEVPGQREISVGVYFFPL